MDNLIVKNVFLRDVLVCLISMFYENVNIRWYDDENKEFQLNIPFFSPFTGSQQFLKDHFLNNSDYCEDILEIEGNINKIPSGMIKIIEPSIDKENSLNKFGRTNKQ